MNEKEMIREVYQEDTLGRRYHVVPISKKNDYNASGSDHGEVKTFNMNQPITRRVFNSMSEETQRAYIQSLVDKYHPTQGQIAEMLDMAPDTLSKRLRLLGVNTLFKRGGDKRSKNKPLPEQNKAWYEFVNGGNIPIDKEAKEVAAPEYNETVLYKEDRAQEITKQGTMSFTLSRTGKLNSDYILKILGILLPDGMECTVSISIDISK